MAVFVACVAFAVLSASLSLARAKQKRRAAAVQRIVELGGTVQQGMVSLAGTNVKDEDLSILVDLDMWDLNLGATEITNAGLKYIPWDSLRNLNLSGTLVDDRGLIQLTHNLGPLRSLKLRMTSVEGIAFPLQGCPALDELDLSLCPVSEEAIRRLAKMKVDYLILAETNIDDSTIPALQQLQVETLDLTKTNVSESGCESLAQARPDLRILRTTTNKGKDAASVTAEQTGREQ